MIAMERPGYRSIAWLRRRTEGHSRLLASSTPVPIRDVADGPVCIAGTVTSPQELLSAPLSGRDCVAYSVSMVLFRVRTRPHAYLCYAEGSSFKLRDGLDAAFVEIETPPQRGRADLSVHIRPQMEREIKMGITRDPLVEKILAASAVENPGRYRRIELREAVIVPGDEVKVIGVAHSEPHPEGEAGDYRSPPYLRVLRAGTAGLLLGNR